MRSEDKLQGALSAVLYFFFVHGKPILLNFQTVPLCLQPEVSIENITGPVTRDT